MFRRISCILAAMVVLAISAPVGAQTSSQRSHTFRVSGMTCGLCGKAIEKAVRNVDGVERVAIDRKAERVKILARSDVSASALEQAIESAGHFQADVAE